MAPPRAMAESLDIHSPVQNQHSGVLSMQFQQIHSSISQGDQRVKVLGLYAYSSNEGGGRIRLTIHRDYYSHQSWAKSERWDGDKWQEVWAIPGEMLKTSNKVTIGNQEFREWHLYADDIDALLQRTREVLE